MEKICLGVLFLMLDFFVNLGAMKIGLLPDFLGYWLILRGMQDLEQQCPRFRKLQPLAIGLTALGLVPFFMDVLALRAQISMFTIAMRLAEQAARLFMVGMLVKGVQDMEKQHGFALQGDKLRTLWLAWAVVSTLTWLLSWIPLVGTVAAVAGGILAICLLIAFFSTARQFKKSA